jgi:alcohol dehydrogenase class IV
VIFGTGSVRTLADPLALEGTLLFVSAQPFVRDTLRTAFEKSGIAWDALHVIQKPPGEPTLEAVIKGAEWFSRHRCSTLVAVGGGSVLDWARLSLAVARGWLDVKTGILEHSQRLDGRPEIVLVPTTCGTGSEAAAVAVYAAGARKLAVVSQSFVADRAVLDAQFLSSVSPAVLASFLCDAISHAVEGFVSIVPNALAKEAAVSALRLILEHHCAPPDQCRNERLMEAGYLGGVAASNCSVGIVHAFAHTVAAYGVPHGVANALGLVAGINANSDTSEMGALVRRAGFASVEGLVEAVKPVVAAAVSNGGASVVRTALADAEERDRIIAGMLTEVALRTNPRRLERAGLASFLDDVDRTLDTV